MWKQGKSLIEAAKKAGNTKLVVVGGAGSLFVDEAKTIRVMDTPEFPEEYLNQLQMAKAKTRRIYNKANGYQMDICKSGRSL